MIDLEPPLGILVVMDRIIKQVGPIKIEWSLNNPMNDRYRVLEGNSILNKKVRREAFSEAWISLVLIPFVPVLFLMTDDMWARILLFAFTAFCFLVFGVIYLTVRDSLRDNLIIDMFHADRNKLDFLSLGEFQIDEKVSN